MFKEKVPEVPANQDCRKWGSLLPPAGPKHVIQSDITVSNYKLLYLLTGATLDLSGRHFSMNKV